MNKSGTVWLAILLLTKTPGTQGTENEPAEHRHENGSRMGHTWNTVTNNSPSEQIGTGSTYEEAKERRHLYARRVQSKWAEFFDLIP